MRIVSRRRLLLVCGILISLGFMGAWLVGLFERDVKPEEISGLDLLLSLFGFFIFLGAIIGFFYLVGQNRRPLNESEIAAWRSVREGGKRRYIGQALIKGFVLGLVCSSFAVLSYNSNIGFSALSLFATLVFIIMFGSYYAAVRFWKSNEEDYETLVQQDPQHDQRLQPTPR